MTKDWHQKLLDWFCSVGVVLLTQVIALCQVLLWQIPHYFASVGQFYDDGYAAGIIGETFVVLGILLPVIIFWHFWDLLQARPPRSLWGRRLSCFWNFSLVLGVTVFLWLLMGTGLFTTNSCDELKGALFNECYISISNWVMVPFAIAVCLLLILCAAKALASIGSRVMRYA